MCYAYAADLFAWPPPVRFNRSARAVVSILCTFIISIIFVVLRSEREIKIYYVYVPTPPSYYYSLVIEHTAIDTYCAFCTSMHI